MTNETIGGLKRLGEQIGGDDRWDVDITGGSIANVVITDATINGITTNPTLRIITSGPIVIAPSDYTLVINQTVGAPISVPLATAQTGTRRLEIKDGKGDAATNPITLTGTVDGAVNPTISTPYGARTIEWNGTQWNVISDALTTGNVIGPGVSTDNAVVRYDGTTGQIIQNSAVTIADTTGIIAGTQGIDFTSVASPPYSAWRLVADSTNRCFTAYNADSNVSMQLGKETWATAYNNSGSSIANGAPVYISGYDAGSGYLTIALASSAAGQVICLGLATETIANNSLGEVTIIGDVHGLNTSGFAAGDSVYPSAVAGVLTNVAPLAPAYRYRVGKVGRADAVNGYIQVTPSTAALGNGTANQILAISNAGGIQEFKTLQVGTAGNNFAIDNSASGAVTLNLPDASATARGVITTGAQTIAGVKTFSSTISGNISGSSGSTTGNAATATALQTARNIGGVSFNGTADIVPQTIQMVNDAADSTCFLVFGNSSGSVSQQPKTNTGLTYNATTNAVGATTFMGALTGNASTATALATGRTIGGVSFDGTANIVPQTIQSVNEATDTTCFPLFITNSGSQSLQPCNNTNLTFNSNTGLLGSTRVSATTGMTMGNSLQTGNVLDWYEEGTWTPTIIGTGTAGAGTYTAQTAQYTRIGNVVQFRINLSWTAHTGTGNMQVAGFPYTFGTSLALSNYCAAVTTGANTIARVLASGSASTIAFLSVATSSNAEALVALDTAADVYIAGVMFL